MPEKIYVLKSKEEAVAILKEFGRKFEFPLHHLDKDAIIKSSVSSNIFRAFQRLDKSPSIIYRHWASDVFDTFITDFKQIDSTEHYYQFVYKYADSLIERWASETKKKTDYMCYGPALKMVNLLVKVIQESEQDRQIDILKFQQVPFDSFSLIPLRIIINDLTNLKYKIAIPSNASMSFVNTPQLYRILMDSIYRICELSEINPILYDYWAWEDKHK
jgi:hypothetical protein